VSTWRALVPLCLGGAAIGALIESANASPVGRMGGLFAAVALTAVGVGVFRQRPWAYGAAFLLGLCWLWATLALRLQGHMGTAEVVTWLAWALVVMVGSVRARAA
jgi:hypothetical protein